MKDRPRRAPLAQGIEDDEFLGRVREDVQKGPNRGLSRVIGLFSRLIAGLTDPFDVIPGQTLSAQQAFIRGITIPEYHYEIGLPFISIDEPSTGPRKGSIGEAITAGLIRDANSVAGKGNSAVLVKLREQVRAAKRPTPEPLSMPDIFKRGFKLPGPATAGRQYERRRQEIETAISDLIKRVRGTVPRAAMPRRALEE